MRMAYKILIVILPITFYIWYKLSTPNSELPKMTKEEIKIYFKKYNKELKHLVSICDNNPEIRFVDTTDIDLLTEYYSEKLPESIIEKIKQMQSIIKELKIYSMHCGSGIANNDNQLAGVSFNLYSDGLSLGGEGQSISFETKAFRDLFKHKKRIKIDWEEVYPLDEEGWSIVFSK